eukprot:8246677-Pyramimonas_sp.AAC.1
MGGARSSPSPCPNCQRLEHQPNDRARRPARLPAAGAPADRPSSQARAMLERKRLAPKWLQRRGNASNWPRRGNTSRVSVDTRECTRHGFQHALGDTQLCKVDLCPRAPTASR